MSVARRLEILMGGPARDLALTAREADTLTTAMGALIERFQLEALSDGGSPEDPGVIDYFRELRARLSEHAGYTQPQ
jgi:hypothetical protein